VKLSTLLQPLPGQVNVDLCIHSPKRFHGVVLNQLSMGVTLPLACLLSILVPLCQYPETGNPRKPPRSKHDVNNYLSWKILSCYDAEQFGIHFPTSRRNPLRQLSRQKSDFSGLLNVPIKLLQDHLPALNLNAYVPEHTASHRTK
jgi:hypothetical protein